MKTETKKESKKRMYCYSKVASVKGIRLPTLFKDIGIIQEIHQAKLNKDAFGGWIYSPKANKEYSFGGQYLPNAKVGDKVEITVSFRGIIAVKEA